MTYLKRFGYLIITGILVAITINIVFSIVSTFFGINLNAAGYSGLFVMCLIWGFAGSFISLLISRWMAKKFHGVQVIDPQTMNSTERMLIDKVYRIARHAGMDVMPEVGIYESADVNAFATGPSKSKSLVAVSTGLLHNMNDAELEGVLAHEIAHIVNGDMVTLTLIQGVINAFAMFIAHIITTAIMSSLRKDDDERGLGDFFLRQSIYTAVSMVLALLGSIVVNYFSRQREFRADAGGASYSSPDKMTAALMKLQRLYELPNRGSRNQEENQESNTLAAMKISGKSSGIAALFMTHPPLQDRIEALRNRTYSVSR